MQYAPAQSVNIFCAAFALKKNIPCWQLTATLCLGAKNFSKLNSSFSIFSILNWRSGVWQFCGLASGCWNYRPASGAGSEKNPKKITSCNIFPVTLTTQKNYRNIFITPAGLSVLVISLIWDCGDRL
jgi:hypothetical protein